MSSDEEDLIDGGGASITDQWLKPVSVTIGRVIPVEHGGTTIGGVKNAAVAGVISFGKTKSTFSQKSFAVTDPYKSSPITTDTSGGVDILDEQTPVAHLFNYSIDKPINSQPKLSLWPFYCIWHLKQLLSAYIGCPLSHISMRDKDGTLLDHYKHTIWIPTEVLQSIKDLPDMVYVFLTADWVGRKDYVSGYSTGERSTMLESIGKSERIHIMATYAAREKILRDISSFGSSGGSKAVHDLSGIVTQTELSAYPPEAGEHVIDNFRLYNLMVLNRFRPKDMSTPNWLTVLSYNDGAHTYMKTLKESVGTPKQLIPDRAGSLGALLLLREKATSANIHAFMITVHSGFKISVLSNWPGSSVNTRDDLKSRSEAGLNAFLQRIYGFFDEDIMRPGSTLPKRSALRKTISIVSYRESYAGGDFEKCREMVSQLAKTDLARITYITTSSIYFQVHQGWSEERIENLYRYLTSRMRETPDDAISNDQEFVRDILNHVSKGPEIQLKSDSSELFIMITGCNGDEEIASAGKLAGMMAIASGYSPSVGKTSMMRDYANLSLLEQIDPLLFGSRVLPGGDRINYSRECQGAARHPVPISIDDALAHPSPSVVILNNITYGGPQAYRAPTDEFPIISFRSVPFQNYCVVCCVQNPIDPSSLRWEEYNECARRMMFDPGAAKARARHDQYYGSPLQFDGNSIIHGRLCNFPKGVREYLPPSAFLYSPEDVDVSNLRDVIEWTVGYPIEESSASSPYEQMSSYTIQGIPVTFLRLMPSSKKTWRASILELGEFYDVPPYVICMWTPDPDQYPTTFHPIVSEDRKPLTTDALKLSMDHGEGKKLERIFTIETMSGRLPGYKMTNMVMSDEYCYAVTVSKGNSTFLVPIRPTRVKGVNVISIQEAVLPTIKQFDELLKEVKNQFPYSALSVRVVTFDEKDNLRTMVMAPDGVTVHIQPSRVLPKEISIESAKRLTVSRHAYEMVWERIKLYPSTPVIVNSPTTSLAAQCAEMYLSAEVIRHGIHEKLIAAAKKRTEKDHRTGDQLSENPRDDYAKILSSECKRFVKIGKNTHIALARNSIILFSERAEMPEELYERTIMRLAARTPKNYQLILPYFNCFGSMLHKERPPLEDWEKILS